MSSIQDVRLVSKTNGCSRLTFEAENLTTGISKIFSIKMAVPDDGITYSLDTLKGRVTETQYNTDCIGEGVGLTAGDTTYSAGTLSLTYADTFNTRNAVDPTICRELVLAVYKGGSFKVGGETYTVIGTNGTRNIGAYTNNKDHKYIFLEEGKVIVPDLKNADGTMATVSNDFITAYKKNNPVACEFLYAFNDDEKKGDRFTYVISNSAMFTEGSGADRNKYTIESERYCDPKSIDKYFIDGLTDAQTPATSGTDNIFRIEADIIIEVAGGGVPTVAGVSGDIALVINATDKTVELYLHDGTAWDNTPVTSTLASGCLIHTLKTSASLDGSTPVTKSAYVAIKTAGTTGNAVCIDAKTGITGSGTSTGIIDTMDWVYSQQTFVTYTGVEL